MGNVGSGFLFGATIGFILGPLLFIMAGYQTHQSGMQKGKVAVQEEAIQRGYGEIRIMEGTRQGEFVWKEVMP